MVSYQSGRHFLQIPGPTNVPDRVLRALSAPTIDHRGPEFSKFALEVLHGVKRVFQTSGYVVIYPSSGTGAWEAALVNTLSPGDKVLMFEIGHFATLWRNMAEKLGLTVAFAPTDWRRGVDPAVVEERLSGDQNHEIKSVMVVHNETSTGCTSRMREIREAIDRAGHPALLMVDTISSLGSIDDRHDEWGVDVTVGCSQKGLLLPPGLGFNAISEKTLAASESARLTRSYPILLGLAGDVGRQREGLLPVHPADQSALRPARGLRYAVRGGSGERLRPPRPARRGHAPGGARLGARAPLREPRGV